MQLKNYLQGKKAIPVWQPPQIFNLSDEEHKEQLQQLCETGKIRAVFDQIDAALDELFDIAYPAKKDSKTPEEVAKFTQKLTREDKVAYGNWIYFPWSGSVVHFPPKDDLRCLRGSRNRNLITEEERQALIDNKTIVIFGLSVGSNVVDSLLLQGVGSKYIIVDMDHLDPTNLNRIRASYDQVGVHKVDVVAKKISELDPYIEQVHYKNGADEGNLEEILTKYRPDIVIDEMDSLRMKVLVRMRAKELGLPVLMATDDGDDILLDIERFDQDATQPILHGILPEEVIQMILGNSEMSRAEIGAIIGQYFVGLENVPIRMLESLMEVGRTLPSWPQLGGAAVLSGLYLSYAARKILLDQNLNAGRFLMGPEAQLNPDLQSQAYKERKETLIQQMQQRPQ